MLEDLVEGFYMLDNLEDGNRTGGVGNEETEIDEIPTTRTRNIRFGRYKREVNKIHLALKLLGQKGIGEQVLQEEDRFWLDVLKIKKV
ncbi:10319_t:CDS:2 [Entrophospora sp. SA101]|nr:10319_t:CDS:2 [Entrophospora sp. SA101]